MNLRKLKLKDAPFMLEWMHDSDVVKYLKGNFKDKTIEDCKTFINNSIKDCNNIHMAIVSDSDEYMGTVSLKDIKKDEKCAEFGISIRKNAMGRGYSWFAMKAMLDYGFKKCGLDYIYWCVSNDNIRACKFYDKHHFSEMKDVPCFAKNKYSKLNSLKWYIVRHDDNYYDTLADEIVGCKIINIKTIDTSKAGKLSFFEEKKDIPFDIKRFYYISKVPEGIRRGFHAHKNLKQLLFCPYGKINIILDDGMDRKEVLLDNPSIGIIIDKIIWREMLWIEKDSVLCVAASEYYDENDYIRDYDCFLKFIK